MNIFLGNTKLRCLKISSFIFTLLLLAILCSCVDDTNGFYEIDGDFESLEQATNQETWGIAIVESDYLSTSISIIDPKNKTMFRSNIINSGSHKPGLSVALSGDVVIAQNHNPENWLVLIDRYPNSVISFISPHDFSLIGQMSVATGFAANPHGFLWLQKNKAYVSRYETNPNPGEINFDQGGDILIVDPEKREITGRIDLALAVDCEGENCILQARPDGMILANSLVWLVLGNLSDDFSVSGDAFLLGIDPQSDEVKKVLQIDDAANCVGLTYAKDRGSVILSCSGHFESGKEKQLEKSAIIEVDILENEPSYKTIRHATESSTATDSNVLGQQQPFAFDVEYLEDGYILATRFGNLSEKINDRLYLINLETGKETQVHESSSAFGIGGLLYDRQQKTIYVGDANQENPQIYLYTFDNTKITKAGQIQTGSSGMPPRNIRFY